MSVTNQEVISAFLSGYGASNSSGSLVSRVMVSNDLQSRVCQSVPDGLRSTHLSSYGVALAVRTGERGHAGEGDYTVYNYTGPAALSQTTRCHLGLLKNSLLAEMTEAEWDDQVWILKPSTAAAILGDWVPGSVRG